MLKSTASALLIGVILSAGCASSPQRKAGDASLEDARRWLAAGGDVNAKDEKGATAAEWAVFDENVPVTKLFLEKGADGSKLRVDKAIQDGNLEMVRTLLEHGSKADGYCLRADGRQAVCTVAPLFWAAGYCKKEIAELLIERGASINPISTAYKGTYGWTPTDWALEDAVLGPIWRRGCSERLAKELISKGGVFRVRHRNTMGDMMSAFMPVMAGVAALNGAATAAKVLKHAPTGGFNGDTATMVDSGPSTNPACGCIAGYPVYREGHCYQNAQAACAKASGDCQTQTCQ